MMAAITGGCRCGAVRYESTAMPITVRKCWCRDCQYFASGNATVNVTFLADAVTVAGPTHDFASTADSGSRMHRRFCPSCGVHLFSAAESRPHLLIVRAGTLDDPGLAQPEAVIWSASAPAWATIECDIPVHEGQIAPPAATSPGA